LLQWRPQEHRALYLLGNLLARQRRWPEAIETYRQIPPEAANFVDSRLRMSAALRLQNRPRHAYEVLLECAKLYPGEGRLFLAMGKLLYDLGASATAVRAFERAVQLLPQDSQAHYLLGFIYNVLGHENWALAAWRKAVDLAPNAHSLRYDLGYMYVRRGRHDLAAAEFQKVLDHWPEDVETNFMLGLCYKELVEPSRSIPLFEKVLRRNPQHAQALYYLGACYLQIGNTSLGKAYLRRYDNLARQAETMLSLKGTSRQRTRSQASASG
jgi:tetratricopeptide (TPR) repeat protein